MEADQQDGYVTNLNRCRLGARLLLCSWSRTGKSAYRNTKGRRVSGLSIPRHVCDFHPIFDCETNGSYLLHVTGVAQPAHRRTVFLRATAVLVGY